MRTLLHYRDALCFLLAAHAHAAPYLRCRAAALPLCILVPHRARGSSAAARHFALVYAAAFTHAAMPYVLHTLPFSARFAASPLRRPLPLLLLRRRALCAIRWVLRILYYLRTTCGSRSAHALRALLLQDLFAVRCLLYTVRCPLPPLQRFLPHHIRLTWFVLYLCFYYGSAFAIRRSSFMLRVPTYPRARALLYAQRTHTCATYALVGALLPHTPALQRLTFHAGIPYRRCPLRLFTFAFTLRAVYLPLYLYTHTFCLYVYLPHICLDRSGRIGGRSGSGPHPLYPLLPPPPAACYTFTLPT